MKPSFITGHFLMALTHFSKDLLKNIKQTEKSENKCYNIYNEEIKSDDS